jgi:hypothetical protein
VLGRRRRAAAADQAADDATVPGQDPADDASSVSFQLAENTAAYPSTHSDHPGYEILFSYRGGGEVTVVTPDRPVEASPVFWAIDLPVALWTPLVDPDGRPVPVELWFERGLVRARWV